MKRYVLILVALCGLSSWANAQSVNGVKIEKINMERSGSYVVVDMDVNLTELDVESSRAVLLTPRIVRGADTLALSSIGVYGRNRYYHYVRNGASMLSGEKEKSYRSSQKPEVATYHAVVPYEAWMNGSQLILNRSDYGCCSRLLDGQQSVIVPRFPTEGYLPTLVYMHPKAEAVKSRALSGSAFIDFVLNKTDIRPEYRNNRVELAKIQATIDSVKNDKDMVITHVNIKGFASPEGSYASNENLAKNRTESLKEYVQQLYHFDPSVMLTSYEAENWAGLKAYVVASNLAGKEGILELIDSDREADNKEWAIKNNYPETYGILLRDCYPALRRTDYRVEYVIRSYTDVKEIEKVWRSNPQKLSLEEFYLLAQQYKLGSDDWNELFETAVRMYPNDEVANLNAANVAMRKGDLKAAERYLAKAGNGGEALYARGVYAVLTNDYPTARNYFGQAQTKGVAQAAETLKEIENQ